jgi:hypothetical protein
LRERGAVKALGITWNSVLLMTPQAPPAGMYSLSSVFLNLYIMVFTWLMPRGNLELMGQQSAWANDSSLMGPGLCYKP